MAIRLFKDEENRRLIRLFDPGDLPTQRPPTAPGKALERFPGTLEQLADLQLDPFSLESNIRDAIPSYFRGIKESIVSAGESLRRALGEEPGRTAAEKASGVLETTARTVGALLSPITALFEAAEKVPVLGTVSRLISLPFSVIGESAPIIVGAAVDKVPDSILSEESKEQLKPGLQEIIALASQLAVGKAGEIVVRKAKINELVKKYGKKDAQTIVTKATEIASKEKGAVLAEPGEPGKIRLADRPLKPIGTEETKVSRLAKGVEERAIENKLTEGLGDLPQFQELNMSSQARLAKSFLEKTPERAKRVALGRELPPVELIPESVFIAVENSAILKGDISTIKSLATESGLTLQATAMGQRIRTLAERIPDSPVSAIIEITKARTRGIKNVNKVKESVKTEIKKEIKKTKVTKETWDSFVDSLIC